MSVQWDSWGKWRRIKTIQILPKGALALEEQRDIQMELALL